MCGFVLLAQCPLTRVCSDSDIAKKVVQRDLAEKRSAYNTRVTVAIVAARVSRQRFLFTQCSGWWVWVWVGGGVAAKGAP